MHFLKKSKHLLDLLYNHNLTHYRKGKEIGATFSGAFSVFGLLEAAADVYNGVRSTVMSL
jgi:hypothetical protein|tara:strand:+ start:7613 stop:7792 length:180 start_codon:yes stop_codon:yes gene_type:complete